MRAGFPLPDTSWEPAAGFWEGAAAGELRIPRCGRCGAWCWYPRPRCPACSAEDLAWTPVSGRGTLFAWAVVRHAFLPQFADKVPYVSGLVCLEEDEAVRVVTEVLDAGPDRLRVGLPMRVVFRPMSFPGVEGEVIAPYFTPAGPEDKEAAGPR